MKVISFSLYGNKQKYLSGMLRNIELAQEIYPDWDVWIYYHENVPLETIREIKSYSNTKLIRFHPLAGVKWSGALERLRPCSEQDVEVMISRDADSRLSYRELAAVEEWLASEKDFHIIRDHPQHNKLILCGMLGARNKILTNMNDIISKHATTFGKKYGSDEVFLEKIIYPLIKNNLFVHDEFNNYEDFCYTIPYERSGLEFIGQSLGPNGKVVYRKQLLKLERFLKNKNN